MTHSGRDGATARVEQDSERPSYLCVPDAWNALTCLRSASPGDGRADYNVSQNMRCCHRLFRLNKDELQALAAVVADAMTSEHTEDTSLTRAGDHDYCWTALRNALRWRDYK